MPIFNSVYKSYKVYKIPTDGLLAYYPLVSDANDHKADLGATGTTYNGTWGGTASYGTIDDKNGALFSRGSNRINTGLSRNTLPITIATCFYRQSSSARETIIGNPTGNNSNGVSLRIDGFLTKLIITNGTGSDKDISTISSGKWINLVMTIESGTTKVYMDGNLIQTFSNGSGGGNTFYIASYGSYTSFGFNGYIRDVAIYSKALSSDEVSDYYNATK